MNNKRGYLICLVLLFYIIFISVVYAPDFGQTGDSETELDKASQEFYDSIEVKDATGNVEPLEDGTYKLPEGSFTGKDGTKYSGKNIIFDKEGNIISAESITVDGKTYTDVKDAKRDKDGKYIFSSIEKIESKNKETEKTTTITGAKNAESTEEETRAEQAKKIEIKDKEGKTEFRASEVKNIVITKDKITLDKAEEIRTEQQGIKDTEKATIILEKGSIKQASFSGKNVSVMLDDINTEIISSRLDSIIEINKINEKDYEITTKNTNTTFLSENFNEYVNSLSEISYKISDKGIYYIELKDSSIFIKEFPDAEKNYAFHENDDFNGTFKMYIGDQMSYKEEPNSGYISDDIYLNGIINYLRYKDLLYHKIYESISTKNIFQADIKDKLDVIFNSKENCEQDKKLAIIKNDNFEIIEECYNKKRDRLFGFSYGNPGVIKEYDSIKKIFFSDILETGKLSLYPKDLARHNFNKDIESYDKNFNECIQDER